MSDDILGDVIADRLRLTVAYRGPEVEEGSIDPQVLAPAMLGMANLIHDVAREVYGPDLKLNVAVTSEFRRGSFMYDFAARVIAFTAPLLVGTFDFDTILRILGIGEGAGLIQFVKWVRQHPPVNAVPQDNGAVTVNAGDGSQITIHRNTYNLSRSPVAIGHLREAMGPLECDGIDEVAVGRDGNTNTVATRSDIDAFDIQPPVEEILEEGDVIEVFLVEIAPMARHMKWWLRTPDGTRVRLRIDDERFWREFGEHEFAFAPGDALRLKIHRTVGRNAGGELVVDRRVVEYVNYLPAPRQQQLRLPWSAGDER